MNYRFLFSSSPQQKVFCYSYPCWMTTRLLFGCGANANVSASDGNTPLHHLAKNIPTTNVLKMVNLLNNADAHLDYINNK
ncbi:unnamed protein product, partial [Rotaria socialis]